MRPRWPLIVFLALLLLCPAALAQSGEISLLGYVTDESGLGISTVSVAVTSEDRSISKTAETDSNGRYEFTCLNDGKYSLRFEMEGFYTEVLPSVPYEYPQAVRIDRRLQIDKLHFRDRPQGWS